MPRIAYPSLYHSLLIAWALALAGAVSAVPARGGDSPDSWDSCATPIAEAERTHRLPSHLLAAISKVESGRWRPETGEILAWPWTVTAGGKSHYLPSKAAAIRKVEHLRGHGIRNIDVGCMQINLKYHPHAFDSLGAAFDPAENVAYAARFLGELKARWGSWSRATGNYHSNTPRLSGRYRAKVFLARSEEKRRAAKAYRAARLAAFKAKS